MSIAECERAKPNIIYILADDMGYGDLSCLNEDSKIRTANLDRLATDGMRFTDAHASSAVCTPSRYSILTGRYNWRSRLKRGVLFGYDRPLIEPGRMTVASLLKGHGYTTACVGKWHLGWTWPMKESGEEDIDYTRPITDGPITHGFDYFFGIIGSLDMPPYVYVENDLPTAIPNRIQPGQGGGADHGADGAIHLRQGPIAPDFWHEECLTRITEKAEAWIAQNAGKDSPFFLYFPLTAPHNPILPTAEFQGKSGVNAYGDFCLQVDDTVRRIMDAVDRAGVAENTIIIFTSDNGCSPRANLKELAAKGHNPSYVFRGHKADIYEGGHRIPLIIRWPARIRAGSCSDETVCLGDLLATCADIVGAKLPDDAGEDSVSNLPVWLDRPLDRTLREATVHHSVNGSFSIRKGKWKLEMCAGSGGWSYPKPASASEGMPLREAFEGGWSYPTPGSACVQLPPTQLYDLSADIGERTNVYDKHPEVASELKALLTRYVEEGRSTPGARQANHDGITWPQLWWMLSGTSAKDDDHQPKENQ